MSFLIILIIVLGSIGTTSAISVNNSSSSSLNSSDKNWTYVNSDPTMSRNSHQSTINNTNVKQLTVKWIFNTGYSVENPPLIVGNTTYVQNNAMQIFAIDTATGITKWKYDPHVKTTTASHGIAINNRIIYAPTGMNGTLIALNAINGSLIWQSPLIDTQTDYYNPSPPILWNNYIIVGGGGGDSPPLKGSITVLNKTNGQIVWHINTTVGPWVQGTNTSLNGGGAVWTGGAVDQNTGIIYLPVGNPSPDFNASTRPIGTNSSYTNCMLAVNITNGKIIWATPFIQVGTVLNVTLPDTQDSDLSWGSDLITVNTIKLLIGHDKHGDIMAMNATNGKPIWWQNLAYLYNSTNITNAVEGYIANDANTLYIPSNSIGKGAIAAIDLLTGKLKWKYSINHNLAISPLVSNGVVYAGYLTNTAGVLSGNIIALDKNTGNLLWNFNLGAPPGIGGPSIGQGMLLVPTGLLDFTIGGYIVAFGLNDPPASPAALIKSASSSNLIKFASPTNTIKPTDPANSTNQIKTLETKNPVAATTIPLQKTGLPLLPAILSLLSVGIVLVERKIRE